MCGGLQVLNKQGETYKTNGWVAGRMEGHNGYPGVGGFPEGLPPPSVLFKSHEIPEMEQRFSNEQMIQQLPVTVLGGHESDTSHDLLLGFSAKNALQVSENCMKVQLPTKLPNLQTVQVVGLDMPHHTQDVVLGCNDSIALNEGFVLSPLTGHRLTWREEDKAYQIRLPLRLTAIGSIEFLSWEEETRVLSLRLGTCAPHYYTTESVPLLAQIFRQDRWRPLRHKLSLTGVPLLPGNANLNAMQVTEVGVEDAHHLTLRVAWPSHADPPDPGIVGQEMVWDETQESCPLLVLPPIPTLGNLVQLINLSLENAVISLGDPSHIGSSDESTLIIPFSAASQEEVPRFRLQFHLRDESSPFLVTLSASLRNPLSSSDYRDHAQRVLQPPVVFARGNLTRAQDIRRTNGLMQYLGFTALDLLPKNQNEYTAAQSRGIPMDSTRGSERGFGALDWNQRAQLPFHYYSSLPVGSSGALSFSPVTGWAQRTLPAGYYNQPEELTTALSSQLNAKFVPDTLHGTLLVDRDGEHCMASFCLPSGWHTPWGITSLLQQQVPVSLEDDIAFVLQTSGGSLLPASSLGASLLEAQVISMELSNKSEDAVVRLPEEERMLLWDTLRARDASSCEILPGESLALLDGSRQGAWLFSQDTLRSEYSVTADPSSHRLCITQKGARTAAIQQVCPVQQGSSWYLRLVLDRSLGISKDDLVSVSLAPTGEDASGCNSSLGSTVEAACPLLSRTNLPLWVGMHRVLSVDLDPATCSWAVTLDIVVDEEDASEENCCSSFGEVLLQAATMQFPFSWINQEENHTPSFLLGFPGALLSPPSVSLCGVSSIMLCGETRRVFIQMEDVQGAILLLKRTGLFSEQAGVGPSGSNAHLQEHPFSNTQVRPAPVGQFVLSKTKWSDINCCENTRNPECLLPPSMRKGMSHLSFSFLTEDGAPLSVEGTHVFLLLRFRYEKQQ